VFKFLDPGRLVDGDLELVLYERYWGDPAKGKVPAYRFVMTRIRDGEELGSVELRVGDTDDIVLYAGQIGYGVEPIHRGHHYAARAVRLLLPLARQHGLGPLWITCNPDNLASRRTCELAGATFVEIVDLPPDSGLHKQGDRSKCRYRLDLPT
jgi:predicted acetyltransferase